MPTSFTRSVFVVLFALTSASAWAQWSKQTLTLQPGWNAVFLELTPEPQDCDSIFAGLPIESVWKWSKSFSTVQFISNPDELLPESPDWLHYTPPSHPAIM